MLTLDFLAAGEAMIDLISHEVVDSLDLAGYFQPYAGGQPSNLAAAMARLGKVSAIAACIGNDSFGRLYLDRMRRTGVRLDLIRTTSEAATTTAIVGRNLITPDFMIQRGADAQLRLDDRLLEAAAATRVFHTSAFALARRPARDTILAMLAAAAGAGAAITFDPNYHPAVWPDTPDFHGIVLDAIGRADIVKPSMEDCRRLFGDRISSDEAVERLLELGARHVILTMGMEGSLVAYAGQVQMRIPTRPPEIVDVTGAGDSFWSGLLSAYLDGRPVEWAACYGQAVAEEKLGYTGPLQPLADPAGTARRAEDLYLGLAAAAAG